MERERRVCKMVRRAMMRKFPPDARETVSMVSVGYRPPPRMRVGRKSPKLTVMLMAEAKSMGALRRGHLTVRSVEK